MHIHMHKHTQMHTHRCTHTDAHTDAHTETHAHIHACIHTHTHMHAHTHTHAAHTHCMHTHTCSTHTHTHTLLTCRWAYKMLHTLQMDCVRHRGGCMCQWESCHTPAVSSWSVEEGVSESECVKHVPPSSAHIHLRTHPILQYLCCHIWFWSKLKKFACKGRCSLKVPELWNKTHMSPMLKNMPINSLRRNKRYG